MSTTFFVNHCHGNTAEDYAAEGMAKKRVRERKFKAFGARLERWRGDMPVTMALNRVSAMGVKLSEATLRSWEYGWTGAPDPVRLLALARAYGKSLDEAFEALLESRGEGGRIRLGSVSVSN